MSMLILRRVRCCAPLETSLQHINAQKLNLFSHEWQS